MRFLAKLVGWVAALGIVAAAAHVFLLWNASQRDYRAAEAQVADVIARGATVVSLEDVPMLRRLPDNLSEVKGLSRLTVADTIISDLTPLSSMRELEYVRVHNSRVHDLTPLAGLPNLTNLGIGKTRVRDLEPLTQLPALERLDMPDIEIASLEPVLRMPAPNWINLHGSYAEDGSQAHYEALQDRVPEVSNGSAFRQNYVPHPDWLRRTRWNRIAEDFGLPIPYPR